MGKDEEREIKVREDKLGDMRLVGVESIDPMKAKLI
jgi:hypothetical protein